MKSLFSKKKSNKKPDDVSDIEHHVDVAKEDETDEVKIDISNDDIETEANAHADIDIDEDELHTVNKTLGISIEKPEYEMALDDNAEEFVDDFDSQPMAIKSRIGFYEAGIKKKEVLQAILNIAQNDFGTKKGVYYNVIKHQGGYLYEVHHGCEFGVLKDVIAKASTQDLILETNDAFFKVYVKSNGHISTLKLRSGDTNVNNFEKLVPKDKLTPLETSGYGIFVFGIVIAVLGILSLSVSSLVKHVFIGQEQTIIYEQLDKVTPSDYVDSVQTTLNMLSNSNYLLFVKYNKTDGWVKEEGTIKQIEEKNISNEDVFFDNGVEVDVSNNVDAPEEGK